MGQQQPKGKPKPNPQKLKMEIEIAVIKVKNYVEINRDKKANELQMKEKKLIQMIQAEPQLRNKDDENLAASLIVALKKEVKAMNIVIRYADLLKARSTQLAEGLDKPENVQELKLFILSIAYAAQPLNLDCIKEFKTLMTLYFPKIDEEIASKLEVDKELLGCFQNIMANQDEIKDFFLDFSNKYGISLETLDLKGHELKGYKEQKDFEKNQKQNPGQAQQQQNQQYFGQHQILLGNANQPPMIGQPNMQMQQNMMGQPNMQMQQPIVQPNIQMQQPMGQCNYFQQAPQMPQQPTNQQMPYNQPQFPQPQQMPFQQIPTGQFQNYQQQPQMGNNNQQPQATPLYPQLSEMKPNQQQQQPYQPQQFQQQQQAQQTNFNYPENSNVSTNPTQNNVPVPGQNFNPGQGQQPSPVGYSDQVEQMKKEFEERFNKLSGL